MNLLIQPLKDEMVKCAQLNHLGFYSWDATLPNGSIDFKQLDGAVIGIQIYVPDNRGYQDYEKIKRELDEIFSGFRMCCASERDLGKKRGWHKELHYMTNDAYEEQLSKNNLTKSASVGNQFNAPVTIARDFNSAETIQTKNINNTFSQNESKKKWYENIFVQWGISFALGVAASIVAQLLLNHFFGISLI